MILAGDAATMALSGLDDLDSIPTNPNLHVEILDGYNKKSLDDVAQILKVCFNWSQEQVDQRMPGLIERMQDERFREREINYMGNLGGRPVAFGRLELKSGVAYLGGAAIVLEYRGQKVYSTLLRRRLEDARAHRYHLAAINAEPMSRRIVTHNGFKEYARMYIYGWMPVMDIEVIKFLIASSAFLLYKPSY